MQHNLLQSEGAAAIARSPHLTRLRVLDLSGCAIRPPGVIAITQSPNLASLERLRLNNNDIQTEGSRALIDGTFPNLTHLDLAANALIEPQLRPLLTREPPPKLRHVALGQNQLQDEGAGLLASSPLLAQLTSLDLHSNRIHAPGLRQIATAPKVDQLRHLNVHSNFFNTASPRLFDGLFDARWANLKSLDLGHTGLAAEAIEALVQNQALQGLKHLGLKWNDMRWPAIEIIAQSPIFASLDSLDLTSCRIESKDAVALARSPHIALTHLHLASNDLGANGVRALTHAPQCARLVSLNLDRNAIGPRGAAYLFSATMPDLEELSVYNNNIGDRGIQTLIVATMPSLRVLNIANNNLTSWGRALLVGWSAIDQLRRIHIIDDYYGHFDNRASIEPYMAPRYSIHASYNVQDFLYHPIFGLGLVNRIHSSTKLEVIFKDRPRKLIHNVPET